jgi:hypothetical protein
MSDDIGIRGQGGFRAYRRRPGNEVVAVRLNLDTDGFDYRKWGGLQRCKRGDWIVNNGGNVYTVDAASFAATYREVSRGRFRKITPVFARLADAAGEIETQEGVSRYNAGDYIVYNDRDGQDGYPVSADEFERLYEPAPMSPRDAGDARP